MKLPRFTLRDLFWLVLVCALAVGWWVERTELQARIDALTEEATIRLALARFDQLVEQHEAAERAVPPMPSQFGFQPVIISPAHEAMISGRFPQ